MMTEKEKAIKELEVDLQSYWNDGLVEAAWTHYTQKLEKYRQLTGKDFVPE